MSFEKILIVEDDVFFAKLLKEKLSKIPSVNEIDILNGGVEFFKHFMLKNYSMVILDYMLKDIDGLQILIEIKEKNIDLPVIIITGKGDESVAVDSFRNGAIDYIIKDFQGIDEIIARIENNYTRFMEKKKQSLEYEELKKENVHQSSKLIRVSQENKSLTQEVEKSKKEIEDRDRKLKTIRKYYESIIYTFAHGMDKTGKRVKGHTARIVKLSMKIADEMKVSDEQKKNIYAAAMLHDIGGQTVEDLDLMFDEEITKDNQKKIKKISEEASKIISADDSLNEVARAVLYRYERWDGTGFPFGLKQAEIPLETRIIQVVDAYDVMINNEDSDKKKTSAEAVKYLHEKSGVYYDPTVVLALEKNVR